MAAMALTEREKMLAGMPYDSRDPELLAMIHRARALTLEYASVPTDDAVARTSLLRELFNFVGDGVWIEAPFFVDYGANISVGESTFINTGAVMVDDNKITIGERVLISPGVQLLTAYHSSRASERIVTPSQVAAGAAPYRTLTAPVTIGDEAWLGAGVIVLPGVSIGARTTVGAGSVVVDDLPPDVLAVGSPARVVKTFDDVTDVQEDRA